MIAFYSRNNVLKMDEFCGKLAKFDKKLLSYQWSSYVGTRNVFIETPFYTHVNR